jgi:hypothetical protein
MPTPAIRLTLALLIILLVTGGGCSRHYRFPFDETDIEGVVITEVNHRSPDGETRQDSLQADRIPAFLDGLDRARKLGATKVWAPYRIDFRLKSGGHVALRATAGIFTDLSIHQSNEFYEFDGGEEFLRQFFPRFFQGTDSTANGPRQP